MPIGFLFLINLLCAALLCLLIIPLLQSLALRYKIFDNPDHNEHGPTGRKIHLTPIPRLGGVGIFLAFTVSNLIWITQIPFLWSFYGGIIIFLLGVSDDIYSISPKIRFLVQLVVATLVVHFDNLVPQSLLLGTGAAINLMPVMGYFLAVFLIVGAINAVNMIDGLDGLAGGLSLISVVFLSLLYFWNRQDIWVLLCISGPLFGALIGFLRHNTYPANIFMGDGGSNWIGYTLAILMLILLSGASVSDTFLPRLLHDGPAAGGAVRPVPLIAVLSALAVPICDTALVMIARIRRGQNPMVADRTHVHHSLLRIGLRHGQAVSAVYFLAVVFGFVGVLPVVYPRYELSWVSYMSIPFLILVLLTAMNLDAGAIQRLLEKRYFIRRTDGYFRFSRMIRYWENANRYLLYLILLAGPAFAGVVRLDVGYAAMVVGVVIIVSTIMPARSKRDDFFDAACVAIASVVLLVANNSNNMMVAWKGERLNIHWIYNSLFYALFSSTIILFLLTIKRRYFVFRSSDFLLAVLPLALLLIPDPYKTDLRLDIISIRSVVVFIAVRTLAKRKRYVMPHIKGVTLIALGFVFLAGVFGLRIVY
jgi:UDP-GlcNAc:undecaprenyl-phosphate GlcNAc-1-phosphate transferase